MKREVIEDALRLAICHVTFMKVSKGEEDIERGMTCTLNPEFLEANAPPAKGGGQKGKAKEPDPDLIVVFDVHAMGWRSFRLSRMTSFNGVKICSEPS